MRAGVGDVSDVTRPEIIRLAGFGGYEDSQPALAADDVVPLVAGGVPVQLPHRSRLEPHGNPGHALGNRQLCDGRLFPVAPTNDLARGLFERELERAEENFELSPPSDDQEQRER